MDIPVYLFTGFLDAGKTKFIQETLSDERFNKGESTLLLLCEDGEESYDPSGFSGPNVFIEPIAEKKDLTAQNMDRLIRKHGCERVVIEYNGMWLLDDLYKALPESWMVYQEFMFADAGSFVSYYSNMRGLVVDKMKSCEMLVLNRATSQIDKQMIHEAVRAANRRAEIAYEDAAGNVTYDEIEDPLPFDMDAKVIEIEEAYFAIWYRDLSEEPEKYKGKTVKVCGFAIFQDDLP
ncbi:MAG: GTPase, partial [Evtepia sp.]